LICSNSFKEENQGSIIFKHTDVEDLVNLSSAKKSIQSFSSQNFDTILKRIINEKI